MLFKLKTVLMLHLLIMLLNDFFRFTPSEINELGYSSLIINSLNAKGSILNAYDDIDNAPPIIAILYSFILLP